MKWVVLAEKVSCQNDLFFRCSMLFNLISRRFSSDLTLKICLFVT